MFSRAAAVSEKSLNVLPRSIISISGETSLSCSIPYPFWN